MLTVSWPLFAVSWRQPAQAKTAAARSAAAVAPRLKCSMNFDSFVSRAFPPTRRLMSAALAFAISMCGGAQARAYGSSAGALTIVYPSVDAQIPAVASSFTFGASPPGSTVTVNGVAATTTPDGAWIAYVPFAPGTFVLHVRARSD